MFWLIWELEFSVLLKFLKKPIKNVILAFLASQIIACRYVRYERDETWCEVTE